ncbi:hypothetical protein HGRIS_004656 [Hohenbuehelia grisea]|uniref:Uncharacterized protein n=1 Tax=Hohenbuehelia grisea TaxID=104357 RepID=A0ABR3JCI0_9AGAR
MLLSSLRYAALGIFDIPFPRLRSPQYSITSTHSTTPLAAAIHRTKFSHQAEVHVFPYPVIPAPPHGLNNFFPVVRPGPGPLIPHSFPITGISPPFRSLIQQVGSVSILRLTEATSIDNFILWAAASALCPGACEGSGKSF